MSLYSPTMKNRKEQNISKMRAQAAPKPKASPQDWQAASPPKPQNARERYDNFFGNAYQAAKPPQSQVALGMYPSQMPQAKEFRLNPEAGKMYDFSNNAVGRSPLGRAMAAGFQSGAKLRYGRGPDLENEQYLPRTEAEMAKLQAEYEASKTPEQKMAESVYASGTAAAQARANMLSQQADRLEAENDETEAVLERYRQGDYRVGPPTDPSGPYAGREGSRMLDMYAAEKARQKKADKIRDRYYKDYEARQAVNQAEMGRTAMGSMAEGKSPEELAQAGRTARMDIGTLVAKYNNQPKRGPNKRPRFDDWVRGLVSTGAINTKDPRDLGMILALQEERGVDYLGLPPRDLGGSAEASPDKEAPAQSRTSEAMNQAAPKQSAAKNSINVPLRQPSMPMGQVDKGLTPTPGIAQPPGVMPDVAYAMRQQGQVLQDPNQRLITDNILPSPEEAGQVVSVDDLPVVAEFPKSSQDETAQRDEAVPMEQAAPPVVNAAEEGGTPLPQIDSPEPAVASWRDITPDPELLREREAQREAMEEAQAASLLRRQQQAALDGEIRQARAAASARPFQSPDAAEFAIRRRRAIEAERAAELENIKQEQEPQRAAAEAAQTAAEAAMKREDREAAERSQLAINTAASNALSESTSVGQYLSSLDAIEGAAATPELKAIVQQKIKEAKDPNSRVRQQLGFNANRERVANGRGLESMSDYDNLFLSQAYRGVDPQITDLNEVTDVMKSAYEANENRILDEIAVSPDFAIYAEKNAGDGPTPTDLWKSEGKDFFNKLVIEKLAKDHPTLLGLLKARGAEKIIDVEKTWNFYFTEDTLSDLQKRRNRLLGEQVP